MKKIKINLVFIYRKRSKRLKMNSLIKKESSKTKKTVNTHFCNQNMKK